MNPSPRRRWIAIAVLAGVLYVLVGILFAVPTTHVRAWRLGAWLASAMIFGLHLAQERARRPSPPRAALHVAIAVALGAFGLALRANLYALSTASASQQRHLLLLSLGLWPILTGVPAFLVALGAGAGLAQLLPRSRTK